MTESMEIARADHDDPTAVVIDVLFATGTPSEVFATFRRDALALRAHWSSFAPAALTTAGWQCTFTLGESKRGSDLEKLREWLAAQAHVRQVVIELSPNWRPARG